LAGTVENKRVSNIDSVGGEVDCVGLVKNYSSIHWKAAFNLGIGSGVNGWWVVQQEASLQGAETSIQMVEALIDESHTDDFDVEPLGQKYVGIELCAETIPSP
jgi:hypothetical protein